MKSKAERQLDFPLQGAQRTHFVGAKRRTKCSESFLHGKACHWIFRALRFFTSSGVTDSLDFQVALLPYKSSSLVQLQFLCQPLGGSTAIGGDRGAFLSRCAHSAENVQVSRSWPCLEQQWSSLIILTLVHPLLLRSVPLKGKRENLKGLLFNRLPVRCGCTVFLAAVRRHIKLIARQGDTTTL